MQPSAVSTHIYLIGGAAAGLAYYPDDVERRLSTDIDARFSPHQMVLDVAAAVAAEHGLGEYQLTKTVPPITLPAAQPGDPR